MDSEGVRGVGESGVNMTIARIFELTYLPIPVSLYLPVSSGLLKLLSDADPYPKRSISATIEFRIRLVMTIWGKIC